MADTGSSSERLSDLRSRWEADRRSRIFLQLAEEYRRQGQPLEAMAVLDEGLSRHPSSVAGKVLQGRCRLESGQTEAAAATLEEVVSRDPTHIVAYRWLTESYLELGDAQQARHRLDIYSQLNPQGEDLPDLSRRLVALEDPARKLSVGAGSAPPPAAVPRPSAQVTEAPTTVMPIPPALRDPSADSEQPTVAVRFGDLPRPQAPFSTGPPPQPPSEAPTMAVPLAEVKSEVKSEVAGTQAAGPPLPGPQVTGRGWPWDRSGEAAEAAPSVAGDSIDPAATEAPTAKLRLESLGLVPETQPAKPHAASSLEPATPAPAAEEPSSEQVTAEVPWWRPRPSVSPWDTQETKVETELAAKSRVSEPEPVASEAPTGLVDTAALLERHESTETVTGAFETLPPAASQRAPEEAGAEPEREAPESALEPAPEAGPPEVAAVSGVEVEDLVGPEAAAPPVDVEPVEVPAEVPFEAQEAAALPAALPEVVTAGAPEVDSRSAAWEPLPDAGRASGHAVPGSGGNGAAALFALDPSDLFESIDLASVPTRPLSIPFWLAHPVRDARRSAALEPATPTLARLYLEQGHATEAHAIYGTLLEREPESEERERSEQGWRSLADVEVTAVQLLGDYEPERGGLTAKQVYVLQRYLARLKGEGGSTDVW